MDLYVGIDLHGNSSVIVVIDEEGKRVQRRKIRNDLELLLRVVEPMRCDIRGIAVESTFNWYWVADGLMDSAYKVHLANPAAMTQYEGLKYTDDVSDAEWLAQMLRLKILPTGYIYPKEQRPLRDLMRTRSRLVRQKTQNILSIDNLMSRNTGQRANANQIKRWDESDVDTLFEDENLVQPVRSSLSIVRGLEQQIKQIERSVKSRARLRPSLLFTTSLVRSTS